MPEDYGADDYGEGVYGGEIPLTIATEIVEYLPEELEISPGKVITRYIEAHDVQFTGFDKGITYTKLSRYVDEAEGEDLEQIGQLFGPLGDRGTRGTEEYRTYLSNLINSFNARGTLSGLRFAVAAAASTDIENIEIDEDFENNEYEISIIESESEFLSSAINELAALADPSGVELASSPIIVTTGDELVTSSTETTVIESSSGLGSGTLSFDGDDDLQ